MPAVTSWTVAAPSGAEALTAVGWAGPYNYENDTAKFSSVVGDWEHRFGARVVAVGFSTLHLSIAVPPVVPFCRPCGRLRSASATRIGDPVFEDLPGVGSREIHRHHLRPYLHHDLERGVHRVFGVEPIPQLSVGVTEEHHAERVVEVWEAIFLRRRPVPRACGSRGIGIRRPKASRAASIGSLCSAVSTSLTVRPRNYRTTRPGGWARPRRLCPAGTAAVGRRRAERTRQAAPAVRLSPSTAQRRAARVLPGRSSTVLGPGQRPRGPIWVHKKIQ
ncbi:DUF4253 domain-containing protein [Streptomyces virginiae]|uniref:DUF4253 domain-containing protein n=1 Tax=Streptomyces virginiae TaxID=1961 RepID=UPI003455904A